MSVIAPMLVEPVLGYRRWRLRYETTAGRLSLAAPVMGDPWDPDEARAEVLVEHPNSQVAGLHAYHDAAIAAVEAIDDPGPSVLGAVAAWGRPWAHAEGFRAERAMVVAIVLPGEFADWSRATREAVVRILGDPGAVFLYLEEFLAYTQGHRAHVPLDQRGESVWGRRGEVARRRERRATARMLAADPTAVIKVDPGAAMSVEPGSLEDRAALIGRRVLGLVTRLSASATRVGAVMLGTLGLCTLAADAPLTKEQIEAGLPAPIALAVYAEVMRGKLAGVVGSGAADPMPRWKQIASWVASHTRRRGPAEARG